MKSQKGLEVYLTKVNNFRHIRLQNCTQLIVNARMPHCLLSKLCLHNTNILYYTVYNRLLTNDSMKIFSSD